MLTIFDTLGDPWKSNVGPTINPVPSDAFTATQDPVTGNLVVINQASKEMAGGLVSANYSVPVGARHFGLDTVFNVSQDDRPHLARHENDLKVTFQGGAQANGSCQWNDDKQIWQLDPSGSTWVDSGCKTPLVTGRNKMQLRLWFDGAHWSVTGLSINDTPFTPGASFQNLPAISSGWGAGLHPQLQTECRKTPWFLRESFERVRVIASDSPIPYLFD